MRIAEAVVGIALTMIAGITIQANEPRHAGYTSDQIMVAMTVLREAWGEPPEGQVAVAQVIWDRVASPSYPNTVREVILQPHQFESWEDRAFMRSIPEDPVKAKALMTILARTAHVQPRPAHKRKLNFHSTLAPAPGWSAHGRDPVQIGNHIFYKDAIT